jgi:hypothetical protein
MKKNRIVSVLFVMFMISSTTQAQHNLGLGMGLDYGGFGGKFTLMPVEKFGLFAGIGYNLAGVGFNGGAMYKFTPSKRVSPYLSGMYGYNGVVVVENGPAESKTYYGPSFSFGIELKSRRNESNFWNFELVLPVRSSEFTDYIDELKNNGYSISEPLPIAFSIGFHFGR